MGPGAISAISLEGPPFLGKFIAPHIWDPNNKDIVWPYSLGPTFSILKNQVLGSFIDYVSFFGLLDCTVYVAIFFASRFGDPIQHPIRHGLCTHVFGAHFVHLARGGVM